MSTSAFAGGTHCAPAETVVFSCAIAHAKVASLCLAKPSAASAATLAYRFGPLGKPELVFPASPDRSPQRFRYAHYFRYQVDRTEVSFSNAGAEYTVYDDYEGETRPTTARGIRVGIGGKDRDLPCRGAVVSKLVVLEPIVPCDAENALSSCR